MGCCFCNIFNCCRRRFDHRDKCFDRRPVRMTVHRNIDLDPCVLREFCRDNRDFRDDRDCKRH